MKAQAQVWLLMAGSFLLAPLRLSASLLEGAPPVDHTAFDALQHGRVDDASMLLRQRIAESPEDAAAHLLLCRVAYAQDDAETAVSECERAAADAPQDGECQTWLGRALGMKASRVNKLLAFSLARRVRIAFERAVALNPGDARAAGDLGEFYIAAPGIIGGGTEKAERLAASIAPRFPSESHRLLALVAEKRGDSSRAEHEFQAAAATGESPEAYVDLGFYYQRTRRPDQAAAAITQALAADRRAAPDRRNGPVLVDAASVLIDAHRMPEVAVDSLRRYLNSTQQSDGAPAFKVHVQLGKILEWLGDRAGARQEYAAAVAMASNYGPAKRALKAS